MAGAQLVLPRSPGSVPSGARGAGKGGAGRSWSRVWSWPLTKEKQAKILSGV